MEVGEDPLAVRERLAARALACAACRGPCRARSSSPATSANVLPSTLRRASSESFLRSDSFSASRASAAAASSGCSCDSRRRRDRGTRGGRLERDPGQPVERGDEDRGLAKNRRPARPVAARCGRARGRAALARDRRPPASGFVRRRTSSQSGSSRSARTTRARQRPLGRAPLERRPAAASLRARRAAGRLPRTRSGTRPGKRCGRGVRGLGRAATSASTRAEQPLASRLRGRVAEALGREELATVSACASRSARYESSAGPARSRARRRSARREREREVRAHADRDAHPAAARDRHRRPDARSVGASAPSRERAPPGREVGGPVRGRQDGHRMAQVAQRLRDPRDVLVHVVRLRPRKRRHEADSQGHGLPSLVR